MNQPPKGIQDYIHLFEEGAGSRWLVRLSVLLSAGVVLALYLLTEARNFSNPEAMETAQLARNIATGRGYTTHVIRPLATRLLLDRAEDRGQPNPGVLRDAVPDIHTPPVYPILLSGLLRILPASLRDAVPADESNRRIPAEVAISLFNLAWLGLAAYLTYRLGSRIFDPVTGTLAATALAGTELFWRMSTQGLSTPVLLVITVAIASCLRRIDEGTPVLVHPEPPPPAGRLALLAAATGALLALGCLTRYAFGWLLIPVVGFLMSLGSRRFLLAVTTVATFAVIVAPWLARNHHLTGRPFGTAGYALQARTMEFPEDTRERRLQKPARTTTFTDYRVKLASEAGPKLRESVPTAGGNWLTFLFLAGLLLPFSGRTPARLRWFLLGSFALLFVVESLGTTRLSTMVPVANSENLLCLLAPLTFLYGAAFFFTLLDSTAFGHVFFRRVAVSVTWVVLSLPLLTRILPPRSYPLVEPIYRPAVVRELASFVEPSELMMSDVPWAVAWYGDRDCIDLPLRIQSPEDREDFYAVHDFLKPVNALYLSPFTTEAPVRLLVTDVNNYRWGWLYLDALVRRNLPKGFPLLNAYAGSARAGHLFLADRPRW